MDIQRTSKKSAYVRGIKVIVYILNIIISVGFATLAVKKGIRQVNEIGEVYVKPNAQWLFLSFVSLIFVYAARGGTGTDTPGYNSWFWHMGAESLISIMESSRDWLFAVVMYIDYKVFHSLFWHNVIIGILLYIPIMKMYIEYTDNFPIAMFLYIVTCAYYFGFNGQRQGVAISIVMLGYPYLLQKKYSSWIVICLIASFFHTTAYLMIPLGFLMTKETDSKIFIVSTIAALLSAIMLWSLWGKLFDLLDALGQDKIVHDYGGMNASNIRGANPIRVLISTVPVILGLFFYKTLKNPTYYIAFNASIWILVFAIAGTRNLFFYRCSAYLAPLQVFIFFNIEKIFDEKSKKFYWISLSALYLVYMWISLHSEGGMLPYHLLSEYRIY